MREERPTHGEGDAAPPSPAARSESMGRTAGKQEAGAVPRGSIRELAELMNRSRSVSFFCGAGCAAAREELLALAERVQAPVAYTLAAKEVMEADNPLAVGMIGMLGWGDAAMALQHAELLVLWGTDFPLRRALPQHGLVAQVDKNPAALGRRVPLCLGVVGDVAQVARELLPLMGREREEGHLCRSRARHGRELRRMHAQLDLPPHGRPSAAYLTRLVSDMAEPDAIICLGLGAPLYWGARYLQARRQQRLHTPMPGGALIGELLRARQQKEAEPGRQVIAFCDDNMRETLSREMPALHHDGLAVKVLLYAHSQPHPEELLHGEVLELVEQAPAAVRRWLNARRAALLTGVVAG